MAECLQKKLLDFMHEKNSPWTECYKKGHRNIEIDKKKIKNYYPVFRDRLPNIETVIAIMNGIPIPSLEY